MDEEDRLSTLPDDIIHQILSCLPMDAAIRTSILSKRWLHQWEFVNVIHFPSLPEVENEMDYGFLDRCLAHLRAQKISKFIIVAKFGRRAEPNFANWINFAVAKHVQSLEFYMNIAVKCPFWHEWDLHCRNDCFKLPDSFYLKDTEMREHIALSCVYFNPPTPQLGFQGYRLLRRLFLFDYEITDEGLHSVVSTCEILESLSIIKCCRLCYPKVSSMSLKEFVYSEYYVFSRSLFEIDAPNLMTLNVFGLVGEISGFSQSCYPLEVRLLAHPEKEQFGLLFNDPFVEDPNNVNFIYDYSITDDDNVLEYNFNVKRCINSIRLMAQLARVQVFGTDYAYFPLLTKALHYNGGPCNTFRSLKEFYFSWPWKRIQKAEVVVLLTFLGDCPCLEKLQLEFRGFLGHPVVTLSMFPETPIKEEEFPVKREVKSDSSDNEDNLYDSDEFEEYEELGGEEEAQLSEAKTLNQLKTIELYYYKGRKSTTDVVRHLLVKAVRLECLLLFYERPKHEMLRSRDIGYRKTTPELEQQMLTEVSCLPRASPCAEIRLG